NAAPPIAPKATIKSTIAAGSGTGTLATPSDTTTLYRPAFANVGSIRMKGSAKAVADPGSGKPAAACTVTWIIATAPEVTVRPSVPSKLETSHCDGLVQAFC